MIESLYHLLPDFYTKRLESEANYTDIDNYESITAKGLITFFLLSIAGSFFLPYNTGLNLVVSALIGIISGFGIPYTFISLRAERRRVKMEKVLPDALRLISSNTRSGHTLEKAFLLSARDEFGPLAEELRLTAMEMYGGVAVEEALRNLESRVNSEMFQETLKLLIDGIKAGGDKADLLESSAEDIRNSMELQKEIQSSIRMYAVFIVMVAVVGAPILFSVSVYMADVTTDMWDDADIGDIGEQGGGVSSQIGFELDFAAPKVDVDFFRTFAYMAILTTNVFAALIISEIRNGNVKSGVKYAPVFCILSLMIFVVANAGIGSALSGI